MAASGGPTVTMITPVRNGAATIGETIASVRAQGARCAQYVVLDALSTDATQQIIEANADVVTDYVRERDGGLYDAMNRGIAKAHGDVVGIVNADDVLMPGALDRACAAFAADECLDFVYSDVTIVDERTRPVGIFRARPDWLEGRATLWHGRDWRYLVAVAHPGLFVRRKVYDRIGGYDLRYRLAADHDFIARLIDRQCRGRLIEEPLACFRAGGLSSGDLRLFREDEAIAVSFGVPRWLARLNRWRSAGGRVKQRLLGKSV